MLAPLKVDRNENTLQSNSGKRSNFANICLFKKANKQTILNGPVVYFKSQFSWMSSIFVCLLSHPSLRISSLALASPCLSLFISCVCVVCASLFLKPHQQVLFVTVKSLNFKQIVGLRVDIHQHIQL